jgi:hypothetical protein
MRRLFMTILVIGVSLPVAAAAASGAFRESLSEPAAMLLLGFSLLSLAGAGKSLLASRSRR